MDYITRLERNNIETKKIKLDKIFIGKRIELYLSLQNSSFNFVVILLDSKKNFFCKNYELFLTNNNILMYYFFS